MAKHNKHSARAGRGVHIAILILFALYCAFMLRVLILRGGYFNGERQLELVPLDTVRLYWATGSLSSLSILNIWGNIGVFIPLGLFLQLLLKHKNFFLSLGIVALSSLMAEVLQYILAVGVTDIDDLLLNTLGGLLGIVLYRVLRRIFKTETGLEKAGLVSIILLVLLAAFCLTL